MKFSSIRNSLLLLTIATTLTFSQSEDMKEDVGGSKTGITKESDSQFNTQKTLFTVGSVLAVTGLVAVTVSGNADIVAPIGGTLFGIGHIGMIMAGISSSKMKKIVNEADGNDKNSWSVPQSGWGYYGVGWGAFAVGIPVIGIGIKNSVGPMVIGGVATLGLGEVMHIISYIKFVKTKNYCVRKMNVFSFSPKIQFDNDKRCLLGCNLQYNF